MIIRSVLPKEYEDLGFSLDESLTEDFLYLLYKGQQIAIFSQYGATRESILEVVQEVVSCSPQVSYDLLEKRR